MIAAGLDGRVNLALILVETDVDKANANNGASPLCKASQNGRVQCPALLMPVDEVDKVRADNEAPSLGKLCLMQEGSTATASRTVQHHQGKD